MLNINFMKLSKELTSSGDNSPERERKGGLFLHSPATFCMACLQYWPSITLKNIWDPLRFQSADSACGPPTASLLHVQPVDWRCRLQTLHPGQTCHSLSVGSAHYALGMHLFCRLKSILGVNWDILACRPGIVLDQNFSIGGNWNNLMTFFKFAIAAHYLTAHGN